MWISYIDSEVNVFHPICQESLNSAISELALSDEYEVLHHQNAGSLEMDFVIRNKHTRKYLCVVEVKKHPTDVYSTRYQFQTMSYVQMNYNQNEKPYYILTSLEKAVTFRYDTSKVNVYQQVLNPGVEDIGSFRHDDKDIFTRKLTSYFKKKIKSFLVDDYEYMLSLSNIAEHIESIKDEEKQWKTDVAVLFYEYIRGSFDSVQRNDLMDIRIYRKRIERICREGLKVNFKNVFSFEPNKFKLMTTVEDNTLVDIYDLGNKNVSGDIIADLLHQIISVGREHLGEVPTDLELGRVLTILADHINKKQWKEQDILADLAAGSGNLISSAIEMIDIQPRNIWANDVNEKLLELLSLRLGLKFVNIINKENSPVITAQNISDIELEQMENVKMIVLNPPFVAGINCVPQKNEIFSRIEELSQSEPMTKIGQMPLEGVFLELISAIAKSGTIIACVFPKNHLTATGNESATIRNLLINKLGLRIIFTYPRTGVFKSVTKDTFVFIGKIGEQSEKVKIINSYTEIDNLDLKRFHDSLDGIENDDYSSIMPGVEAKLIMSKNLIDSIDNGWRNISSGISAALNFVNEYIEKNDKLQEFSEFIIDKEVNFKRGNIGNKGASDLLFVDTHEELKVESLRKGITISPAIRRANSENFILEESPNKYLTFSEDKEADLLEVINKYQEIPVRLGRQARKDKTNEEILKIIKSETQKISSGSAVMIPRNIRRKGRVYVSIDSIYVSTNFFVLAELEKREALLVGGWVSTIFYQLTCEVRAKDQEGTRKMEIRDINTTYIPDFNKISDSQIDEIIRCSEDITFIDLQDPEIREIDIVWAKILFGDDYRVILDDAKDHLEVLANQRNS